MSSPYPTGATSAATFAVATVEEWTSAGDILPLTGYTHLLSQDTHSIQTAEGYGYAPLTSITPYSYERWLRIRFDKPFNRISNIRFWSPNYVQPTGWTLNFGTTGTYALPVRTASTIATTTLPMSDPGRSAPNVGPSGITGSGTVYSNWVVIQAHVDVTTAAPGPILGFASLNINPVMFSVAWIES